MIHALAMLYHKLPSELLALSPGELYLNMLIANPEIIKRRIDQEERGKREKELGYNPVKKFLEILKHNRGE